MAAMSASKLHDLATKALEGQRFPEEAAREVAEEFVIAEYAGVRTHGVGKIPSLNLGQLDRRPTINYRGAVVSVNGNQMSGFLLMREIATQLIDIVRRNGVGLASVRNFSRYSSLYPYTEQVAHAGFVAVLMNSAGPAAVTPFGSIDPVTGTNPICFSFPTGSGVRTFDFTTAEIVWGEIRQAALEGRGVKQGAFLDSNGEITTVPADVNAVRAFGGAKGFALNLAIEILAGPLVGGRAGLDVESEFDGGALMLAIDPNSVGASAAFPDEVSRLLEQVRAARPEIGGSTVRAPGDRGRSAVKIRDIADERVDVADATAALLHRMAAGESISELTSNPLYN